MTNPYRWDGKPAHIVPLDEEEEVVRALAAGQGVVVAGACGMGKSMLLARVTPRLAEIGRVANLVDPREPTLNHCLELLAETLGVKRAWDIDGVLDQVEGRVTVVIDEIDRWARIETSWGPLARVWVDTLETARRNRSDLGILVAGGYGIHLLDGRLGSPFMSRARVIYRRPFGAAGLRQLAAPCGGLDEEATEAMLLTTGGVPAVSAYILQHSWPSSPTSGQVAALGLQFRRDQQAFCRQVKRSLGALGQNRGLLPLLERIAGSAGSISVGEMSSALPDDWEHEDALDLLAAAGLIGITGSVATDPVQAQVIPSVLLPSRSPLVLAFEERLVQDLAWGLGFLHRQSMDLYHRGNLLPEGALRAMLAILFAGRGWEIHSESLQVGGRTDLRLAWPGEPGHALIEVKRWGTHHRTVHEQLCGYLTAETRAAAVAMFCPNTPRDYAGDCALPAHEVVSPQPPDLLGAWRVPHQRPEGSSLLIHHLAVRIVEALER